MTGFTRSLKAFLLTEGYYSIEIPSEILIHDNKTNGKLSVGKTGLPPVFGASLSEVYLSF